tara:strand:- start:445 stop:558 length:114 start_codon:yes stop_codon:yes gene_type:complete
MELLSELSGRVFKENILIQNINAIDSVQGTVSGYKKL